MEDADRVACLQRPDGTEVHPLVWHTRLAVGEFELASEPTARTRPRIEAVYEARVPRALAGERFTFPANLAAPALTPQSQPLTDAERADAQRWALEPDRRPGGPAVPVGHGARATQPVIRHDLAWRVGIAAVFDRRHAGDDREAVNRLNSV